MKTIKIGRDERNDIVLKDSLVSRYHAELILYDDGKIILKDMGSSNGTFVNRIKVSESYLNPGDIVKCGAILLNWEQYVNIQVKQNEKLSLIKVANSGLAAMLANKSEITIGRSNESDIVVNDAAVSRNHLKVFKMRDEFYVEDMGSTNGTYLNQNVVKSRTRIYPNDTLYVGLHKFSLNNTAQDFTGENAIQAIGLKKEFKNGNIGLQPINLTIKARNMVALMGPSGCGKSTLLKALNGDNPATSGSVYIFGLELIKNYGFLKRKIGYVPQDDIVHSELSVNDTLYYAAKLRLADNALEDLVDERISEVLSSLNLNEPLIRNTRIKNLSGGQRKRVSIAVELLNKPSLLFLDEPTSSLDPETIEEFLKCLKNLCSEGTTVIMVTHKPEDLHFVDEIIFLGKKGYHVFEGPQENFLRYFSKNNILEVYSLINSEQKAKEWYNKLNFNNTSHQVTNSAELKKNAEVSILRQLFWLSKRYLDIKLGNRKNVLLMFFQPLLIGILLKLSFKNLLQDVNGLTTGVTGAIFMIAISAIWFGVSNSAKEIIGEKAIFRRERMYNLSLGNYFMSKWIVLTIISVLQLSLFLAILKVLYTDDLQNFGSTLFYLVFLSSSSILFGLLLSAISESIEEVMTILPIVLLAQIILTGVITPLQSKITECLSFLTFGRWGTEGIARLQDQGQSYYMKELNMNLYNDKLFGPFNSLSKNVAVILVLDVIIIAGIIAALTRMDRNID